jgi:hypothetical protein
MCSSWVCKDGEEGRDATGLGLRLGLLIGSVGVLGSGRGWYTGVGFGLLSVSLHSVVLINLAVSLKYSTYEKQPSRRSEQPEQKSMLGPDETRRQRL